GFHDLTPRAQPTASTLATISGGLAASTREQGTASPHFFFASAALTTAAQSESAVDGAIATPVPSARILAAIAPSSLTGLGSSALSRLDPAASNGAAPIEQVFAEFANQIPDFFDIELGMVR